MLKIKTKTLHCGKVVMAGFQNKASGDVVAAAKESTKSSKEPS